jgi:hypothetical protein
MSAEKPRVSVWKVLRWATIASLLVVVVLMLMRPGALATPLPPEVAKQMSDEVLSKWKELELAHTRGEPAEARFSTEEMNAALQQGAQEQAVPQPAAGHDQPAGSAPAPGVSDAQVAFIGDHAAGQFVAHMPGKDIYLTFSCKIGVVDGYANFEFTEARIGNLPVPVSLINPQLQNKLQEPEVREKLKLPDYVAGLRIENGQLVVVEK